MSFRTFRRGVHPYDGKELSADCEIRAVSAPKRMVYPLSQSIGAPSKPCVSAGERVLKGQMIAEAGSYVSAPIHSSVSGTVKAIEPCKTANGTKVLSIIVENDELYEKTPEFATLRNTESLTAEEIVAIIRNSGIVGLGGAGFPTAVKLSPKNPAGIDTIIINAAECEPYLTSDYRLLLEKSSEIVKGVKVILKIFPSARAVIGIENNKPDAVKAMENATANEEKINVAVLKTKYPQGGERQLIYALTKRSVNSKILPADKGCIVVNTASCFAIYNAVCMNIPLISRVMTVSGEGAKSPCNLEVPIGMSQSDVLEAAGGADENTVKFISGGPMMGLALESLDVPVVKTSSSILAFTKDDVAALPASNCIHCGGCVSACPASLVPQMMAKAVKANDFDKFAALGGGECIECGCCTYVCPAKIPLTQMFRLGKVKVKENKAKEGGEKNV